MKLLPVGSRPKCLHCGKELRPDFKYIPRPFGLTAADLKQWKKDHPKEIQGYGGYGDNRFCGLTCGYRWAIMHTKSFVMALLILIATGQTKPQLLPGHEGVHQQTASEPAQASSDSNPSASTDDDISDDDQDEDDSDLPGCKDSHRHHRQTERKSYHASHQR